MIRFDHFSKSGSVKSLYQKQSKTALTTQPNTSIGSEICPPTYIKQQNLDMIVHSLVARWQDLYEEQWKEAKIKIDIEADEYKKRIIEEMRPQ